MGSENERLPQEDACGFGAVAKQVNCSLLGGSELPIDGHYDWTWSAGRYKFVLTIQQQTSTILSWDTEEADRDLVQ